MQTLSNNRLFVFYYKYFDFSRRNSDLLRHGYCISLKKLLLYIL